MAAIMRWGTALFVALMLTHHSTNGTPMPRTFGTGMPCISVQPGQEVSIFSHTLAAGSTLGAINHLWSVGGGAPSAPQLDGVQIYRFYIDGETVASVQFSMRMAAGVVHDPVLVDREAVPVVKNSSDMNTAPISAPAPWGNLWFGKGSDMDGYYNNFQIPFQKSINVTVSLPSWIQKGYCVWTILRGQENVPVWVGGHMLPAHARMKTHHNTDMFIDDMAFVPLLNQSNGTNGVVWSTTYGIRTGRNPHINPYGFLEGCFHLITPYHGVGASPLQRRYGVSADFPGVVLSTGMEDYYDSSFYFHAGISQLPVSGVTHMCAEPTTAYDQPRHPACLLNETQWSGYRNHFMDPLWFSHGVQLLVRNGGAAGPMPAGLPPSGDAKCYNLEGDPGYFRNITISSLVWTYEWEDLHHPASQ